MENQPGVGASLAESLRIVICGLRNAGKSALMNQLLEREVSIVSERQGTTTDPITRKMELEALGAVAITDTAGLDDEEGGPEGIGAQRRRASMQQVRSADLLIFLSAAHRPPEPREEALARELLELCDKQESSFFALASFADMGFDPAKRDFIRSLNQEAASKNKGSGSSSSELASAFSSPAPSVVPPPSMGSRLNVQVPSVPVCRDPVRIEASRESEASSPENSSQRARAQKLPLDFVIDNISRRGIEELKGHLIFLKQNLRSELSVLDGLVREDDFVLLVAPVDLGAPKGRLITPQVETIRDCLDKDCAVMLVKERELYQSYQRLSLAMPPKLVVTDSQAFAKVAADLPPDQLLTSFSILFARKKGKLEQMVEGVLQLEQLPDAPRILMMESCSHHRQADDIGKVKIPRLLRQLLRPKAEFSFMRSLPPKEELASYDLVVHCGGCMSTRRKLLNRFARIEEAGVPLVNYGLFLGWANGMLPRALEPFTDIFQLYQERFAASKMQ